MKTLCIFSAYNEIEFLYHKKKFCEYHGLDLYVVDNYSNDGTWEWLQDNKIPSHRLDTNSSFHLSKLQSENMKVIHKIKPDWVLYNGADTFPFCTNNVKISDVIERHGKKCDIIPLPTLNIRNTGEEWNGSYFNTYYHADLKVREKLLFYKYTEKYRFIGDDFSGPSMKRFNDPDIDFLQLNYGAAKPEEIQKERFKRRQKAWAEGLPKGFGSHYILNDDNKYIYNKESCLDIRSRPRFKKILDSIQTIFD